LASVDPSIGRIAGSRPLQVEPIIIWLHPSVYEKKASSPAGHPLFLSYLPRRLQEIRRNFIFEIPDPLWGIDRVSLPEHSYIIEVNGVPLSIEGVYPDRSFCPRFRAIENLVSEEARNSIRSFNPLTGGRDGAWIESDDIPYFEQFGVELWDSFEYIARHMEMVIYRHLASFAGFQQVENSLLKYYDPDNEAALEARNKLLGATRAGHQAKASFVRTLQLLVAERAPAQDLGTMLAVFGEMWTPGCDLTPIVEAIRFKQKDALPRNRRGTQLVKLSLEFEATVSQWLHTNASDRVFEVTPQVKSRLLDEIGKQLDPAEAHRAAIVVGNFLLRPYLARLIATDYPQLTVLAERELRDDLRSDASLS
jgi:flagellar biosynthesis component FlhA